MRNARNHQLIENGINHPSTGASFQQQFHWLNTINTDGHWNSQERWWLTESKTPIGLVKTCQNEANGCAHKCSTQNRRFVSLRKEYCLMFGHLPWWETSMKISENDWLYSEAAALLDAGCTMDKPRRFKAVCFTVRFEVNGIPDSGWMQPLQAMV